MKKMHVKEYFSTEGKGTFENMGILFTFIEKTLFVFNVICIFVSKKMF